MMCALMQTLIDRTSPVLRMGGLVEGAFEGFVESDGSQTFERKVVATELNPILPHD